MWAAAILRQIPAAVSFRRAATEGVSVLSMVIYESGWANNVRASPARVIEISKGVMMCGAFIGCISRQRMLVCSFRKGTRCQTAQVCAPDKLVWKDSGLLIFIHFERRADLVRRQTSR